ncbi:MAG: hypothetical protein LBP99_05670 [Azoarcus sp.]|jgi:hypothetical protein|nr:hypothetical protein [Azoarcus sp.]
MKHLFLWLLILGSISATHAEEGKKHPEIYGWSTKNGADIEITGRVAKDLFDKMPESTLIPTKNSCAAGRIMKLKKGLVCFAPEGDLDMTKFYSCQVEVHVKTGDLVAKKAEDYLACDP